MTAVGVRGQKEGMPTFEIFPSRGELDRRAQALKSEGAVVLPDDQPEAGVYGYTVLPTSHTADIRLAHFVHGKPLKPEIRVVDSADDFASWLREHSSHTRSRSNAPKLKQIGMVCFCKASEGRSQVVRIPVDKTRTLDPALLGEIMRAPSV